MELSFAWKLIIPHKSRPIQLFKPNNNIPVVLLKCEANRSRGSWVLTGHTNKQRFILYIYKEIDTPLELTWRSPKQSVFSLCPTIWTLARQLLMVALLYNCFRWFTFLISQRGGGRCFWNCFQRPTINIHFKKAGF